MWYFHTGADLSHHTTTALAVIYCMFLISQCWLREEQLLPTALKPISTKLTCPLSNSISHHRRQQYKYIDFCPNWQKSLCDFRQPTAVWSLQCNHNRCCRFPRYNIHQVRPEDSGQVFAHALIISHRNQHCPPLFLASYNLSFLELFKIKHFLSAAQSANCYKKSKGVIPYVWAGCVELTEIRANSVEQTEGTMQSFPAALHVSFHVDLFNCIKQVAVFACSKQIPENKTN